MLTCLKKLYLAITTKISLVNEMPFMHYVQESENLSFIKQTDVSDNKRFIFLVPGIGKFSGGQTTILRLGTELSKLGYKVIYADYTGMAVTEINKNSKFNLDSLRGEVTRLCDLKDNNDNDIIVATFWQSCYFAKKLKGHKVYFVQDYEPYFYSFGDKYLLCRNTYEMGFHIISLGGWNLELIKRNCSLDKDTTLNSIDFAFNNSEFYPRDKKIDFKHYNTKKTLNLCIYIKDESKRAPYLIQALVTKLKERFNSSGINLEAFYFGGFSNIKLSGGKNLGKLDKKSILELFHKCDFGLVASFTNLSLITLEMMASKLPLIEFKDGSFPYFFKDKPALLTDFNSRTLYDSLVSYLDKPKLIEEKVESAYLQVRNLTWVKSAKQFLNHIKNFK